MPAKETFIKNSGVLKLLCHVPRTIATWSIERRKKGFTGIAIRL